jgi:hypothetical protein
MPKKAIDYSKSCIYKICCKDPDITDIYIGSTTELTKRRYKHKQSCVSPKQVHHNLTVYKYIRDNGGWDNWEVVKIENYKCNCREDLFKRERELFEILKPTLNKNRPIIFVEEKKKYDKEYRQANKDEINKRKREKITCECGATVSRHGLSRHRKSKKHEKLLQQQQHQN